MPEPIKHKPTGTLFLVVGPSGSGKDTLIDAAREHFGDDPSVYFPRRIITREDTSGEDHLPVTVSEFETLQENNELFLYWEAHGLQYGVPEDVRLQLEQGSMVILNISRRLVSAAKDKWPNTKVIQIYVNEEVLFERLKRRGRESEEAIKARFERRSEPVTESVDDVVDNSGDMEQGACAFIEVVSKER